MKKIVFTFILFSASLSSAIPVVGSKKDIASSDFCKTYHCALWKSNLIDGTTLKEYWYTSINNTLVHIVRNKSGSITMAQLGFPGMENTVSALTESAQFIKDFNTSFAGFSPSITNQILDKSCHQGFDTRTGHIKTVLSSKGNIQIICELQLGSGNNAQEGTSFSIGAYLK